MESPDGVAEDRGRLVEELIPPHVLYAESYHYQALCIISPFVVAFACAAMFDLGPNRYAAIAAEASGIAVAREPFLECIGQNGYPERFVSHDYIRALAATMPRAAVVEDLPLVAATDRNDQGIDAVLLSVEIRILAEFKWD